MTTGMRWDRVCWGLWGAAFCLRLVVLLVTGRLVHPESYEYETMAINFLAGRGLVYDFLGIRYASFVGPVYPLICAAIYALTNHSHVGLLLIQAAFASLAPVIVMMLGRILFGRGAGVWAGLLAAVHPGLVIYTTKIHPLVSEGLLLSAFSLGLLTLGPHASWWKRGWVGLVLGLAILPRPVVVLFIPLAGLWLLWRHAKARPQALWTFMTTLVIALGVIAPWAVRNYRLHGEWVFVQSTSGMSFWKGNHPQTTGTNINLSGHNWLSEIPQGLRDRLAAATREVEHDRLFWQAGWAFVQANPAAFLDLWGKKWLAFWWFSPTTGWLYPAWYFVGYRWWYILTMLVAMIGIMRGLRHPLVQTRQGTVLLMLFSVTVSVAQSLFYVEGRHRWLIEPLLLVFAGEGIVWLGRALARPPARAAAEGPSHG